MAETQETCLAPAREKRNLDSLTRVARSRSQPQLLELPLEPVESLQRFLAELVPSRTHPVDIPAHPSSDAISRIKASLFGRFYQNHLKRYAIARHFARLLIARAYPAYLKHIKCRITNRRQQRWQPICSLNEYAQRKGLRTTQLADAAVIQAHTPHVLPAEDRDWLIAPSDSYAFPSIYVAKIPKATVYGGSNLVFSNGRVISHDLYDFQSDYTTEECHRRAVIDARNCRLRWLDFDHAPVCVPEAATFVDGCGHNYAHWLSEVLPRIAAFCALPEHADIPIIINAGLHQNLLESLDLISGHNRPRIMLAPGRAVCAEQLHLTSVAGYVPFQNRHEDKPSRKHGVFSPYSLHLIRKQALPVLGQLPANYWPEKIYLRRISGMRNITNRDDIEPLLASHGFVAVEPEKLSFLAQAHLFSQAKAIVAPTGASIATAIFCNPHTKLCILMGKHEHMIYRYWVNMLMPLGIDVTYILGEQTDKLDLGIHADYAVDPQHLSEVLSSWSAA